MRSKLALLLLLGACSPSRPMPFRIVYNGGVGARVGACTEQSVPLDGPLAAPGLQVPGCGSDRAVTGEVGATFVYWQTSTSASLVGPVVSSVAQLDLVGLDSGGGQRGLQAGGGGVRLTSGGSSVGLNEGGGAQGLGAGGGSAALGQGGGALALNQGGSAVGLSQGGGDRGLNAGGAQSRFLRLTKSFSDSWVYEGRNSVFTLHLTNDGVVPLVRYVLIDRVDPWLEVLSAEGAALRRLPDQSTLVVWDVHRVLPPGEQSAFTVTVRARAPETNTP